MSRAIVTGMIATYPVGGVVWDYGQYALGLERLGFDVWYLEDTGWLAYDPRVGDYRADFSFGAKFLERSLRGLSPRLAERWHVRGPDGSSFGADKQTIEKVIASADLFLNISGSAILRGEYAACPRKVFVDTDPGWTQFVTFPRWDSGQGYEGGENPRAHDHFLTYAERIGSDDCVLPTLGLEWRPTRPPVVLDCWEPRAPGANWTTVMTWNTYRDLHSLNYEGVAYGAKELEFPKVESLPKRTHGTFELAIGGADPPIDHWKQLGWSVLRAETISRTADQYRKYVEESRGEFSVAKNAYVATRSGWFSCRSVCYLASGRPAILQDTGFSEVIPTGAGLLAFEDLDQAVAAFEEVESAYDQHSEAAREIAREHFASERVLTDLLSTIGLS